MRAFALLTGLWRKNTELEMTSFYLEFINIFAGKMAYDVFYRNNDLIKFRVKIVNTQWQLAWTLIFPQCYTFWIFVHWYFVDFSQQQATSLIGRNKPSGDTEENLSTGRCCFRCWGHHQLPLFIHLIVESMCLSSFPLFFLVLS